MSGPDLTVLIVAPLLAIGLAIFLNRTIFGQTVKASANNPDLARLQGHRPQNGLAFRVDRRRRSCRHLDDHAGGAARRGDGAREPRAGDHDQGTRGRGDRRDVLVPPSDPRRLGDRPPAGALPVHPPRPARTVRLHPLPSGRGGCAHPESPGSSREELVLVRVETAAHPRTPEARVVDSPLHPLRGAGAAGCRHHRAAHGRFTEPPLHLHPDRGLRRVRRLGHDHHRLGRPGLARPDGLRRVRCLLRRGSESRYDIRCRLGRSRTVRRDAPRTSLCAGHAGRCPPHRPRWLHSSA